MVARATTGLAGLMLVLASSTAIRAEDPAASRFKGTDKTDPIRITHVSVKPAGADAAGITFDVAWDHSWRTTWEEPSGRTGGPGPLGLESWDAAWVFVKFRNSGAEWTHATLSAVAGDHTVPAGAALDVGLSDDPARGGTSSTRGLGVFLHRDAPGSGPTAWKKVTLRWLHATDGLPTVDKVTVVGEWSAAVADKPKVPKEDIDEMSNRYEDSLLKELDALNATRAATEARQAGVVEIQVLAIHMVYVPECAYWLGDGTTNRVAGQFTAGDSTAPFRLESEAALTLGGTNPKNLGNSDGVFTADDFNSALTQPLPAPFPKGVGAFYCMKRELTLGEVAAYLNASGAEAAGAIQQEMAARFSVTGTGAAATFATATPEMRCSGLTWDAGMTYAAWAGLRPMTELEFEKACRGPLTPVPGEFAWGSAETASAKAGPSYWGVLDLSGGLWDLTVSVGHPRGRRFTGRHGNGTPALPDDWRALGAAEKGRGGVGGDPAGDRQRVSDREQGSMIAWRGRQSTAGFRFVRSPAAGLASVAPTDESVNAVTWFNDALRIANLTVTPRDAKTASITFDIAWDDSWRNATNYDAAWVFFKARAKGTTEWQHVRLVADKILNPTGYGQGEGTKLEYVVPDGVDGFTGVFVQRAAAGIGPLAAKGVTVVAEMDANIEHRASNTEHRTQEKEASTSTLDVGRSMFDVQKADIQAFGLEMVYVPEGPFSLGSGGSEQNRFYRYTDGSQNTQPYRVLDAGTIPTGPQAGRLWATGVRPEGSDAGEIPATFPNGYRAFYGMKFSIKQGQFAGFLAMQSEVRSDAHAYRAGNGPALVMEGAADAVGLSWWQGATFGAWAGLRPMTELEYEKACRGPQEPLPYETTASYWGFRDLNLGMVYGRVVSVATPAARAFAGTHGLGTTALPADWPPPKADGVMRRGSGCSLAQVSLRRPYGIDENPDLQHGRLPDPIFDGWRGVRTAPGGAVNAGALPRAGFRLEMDPLPDLRTPDVIVFYLSGRFRNDSDQSLKVEVTTPMPEACFPEGAASRAFTAAPKAATPFKILTVLTRQTGRAVRRGQMLPIRIQALGGDVLAEQTVRLPLLDPLAETPPVVGSIGGGTLTLLVTNFTDRPQSLTFEMMPPPGITVAETTHSVEIGTAASAEAAFAIPGQVFGAAGFRCLPYRVSVAKSVSQAGDIVAEMRPRSRWRVAQRQIQNEAALAFSAVGNVEELPADLDAMLVTSGLGESAAKKSENKRDRDWAPPQDIFTTDNLPKGWATVTHGASLWVTKLTPLPMKNTIVQAATRVIAPSDREAVVKVASESSGYTWVDNTLFASRDWGSGTPTSPFVGRIWFNGEVVYDSRPDVNAVRKNVRIRKGANTMLVQCLANATQADLIGNVFVLFYDVETGTRMADLELDVEKR